MKFSPSSLVLTVLLSLTSFSAKSADAEPPTHLLSSRFISTDVPRGPQPFIHLGCENTAGEVGKTALACKELRFFRVEKGIPSSMGERTFKWNDFRAHDITLDIPLLSSNRLFTDEAALSPSVKWNEGDKMFPERRKGLRKFFNKATGVVEWTLFHAVDAVTWTLSKPHYWNVRALVRSNLRAFEFLTEKPNEKSGTLSEGFFTIDKGYDDLEASIVRLATPLPEADADAEGETESATPPLPLRRR